MSHPSVSTLNLTQLECVVWMTQRTDAWPAPASTLAVPFPTEADALVAHNTLSVDSELTSNTTRELRVDSNVLHVTFTAREPKHLRASLVRLPRSCRERKTHAQLTECAHF